MLLVVDPGMGAVPAAGEDSPARRKTPSRPRRAAKPAAAR